MNAIDTMRQRLFDEERREALGIRVTVEGPQPVTEAVDVRVGSQPENQQTESN